MGLGGLWETRFLKAAFLTVLGPGAMCANKLRETSVPEDRRNGRQLRLGSTIEKEGIKEEKKPVYFLEWNSVSRWILFRQKEAWHC